MFDYRKAFTKNMLSQVGLFPPVDDFGCNFRCCTGLAELHCRKHLSGQDLKRIYLKSVWHGWITGRECYIKKPQKIANFALQLLNSKVKAYNTGFVKNSIPLTWKRKRGVKFDFRIVKLYQPDRSKRHFVIADKDGVLLFDPYPNSKSAKLWNVKDQYLYRMI